MSWSRLRSAAGSVWGAPFVIWDLEMVSSFFLELMRELGLNVTRNDLSQNVKIVLCAIFEWCFMNYKTTARQFFSVLFLSFCSHRGYSVIRSWVKV